MKAIEKVEIKRIKDLETQRLKALKAIEKEKARKIEMERKAKVAKQRAKELAEKARVKKKQEEEVERKRLEQERERLEQERVRQAKEQERLAVLERSRACQQVVKDMAELICRQHAWEDALIIVDQALKEDLQKIDALRISTTSLLSSPFSSSSTSPKSNKSRTHSTHSTSSTSSTGSTDSTDSTNMSVTPSPSPPQISFNMISVEVAENIYATYRKEDGWQTHQNRCQMSDMGMSISSSDGLLGILTYSIRILGDKYFVTVDTFGVVSSARKRGIGSLLMSIFCFWFKLYVGDVNTKNQAILFVETAKTDTASQFWESVVGQVHRHDSELKYIINAAGNEGKGDAFFLPLTNDRSRCFVKPKLEHKDVLLSNLRGK